MTTYKCAACLDHRMVLDDRIQDGIERWRPCKFCNAAGWERWHRGHYDPQHSCSECADIARGRRSRGRGDDE